MAFCGINSYDTYKIILETLHTNKHNILLERGWSEIYG